MLDLPERFHVYVGHFCYLTISTELGLYPLTARYLDWLDGASMDDSGLIRKQREYQDKGLWIRIWD